MSFFDSTHSPYFEKENPFNEVFTTNHYEDTHDIKKSESEKYIKMNYNYKEESFYKLGYSVSRKTGSKGIILLFHDNIKCIAHNYHSLMASKYDVCSINVTNNETEIEMITELIKQINQNNLPVIMIGMLVSQVLFDVIKGIEAKILGIILVSPEKKSNDVISQLSIPFLVIHGQKSEKNDWKTLRDLYLSNKNTIKGIKFFKDADHEINNGYCAIDIDKEISMWIRDLNSKLLLN